MDCKVATLYHMQLNSFLHLTTYPKPILHFLEHCYRACLRPSTAFPFGHHSNRRTGDMMPHLLPVGKHVEVAHSLRGPQPHHEAGQRLKEEVEVVAVVPVAPVEHRHSGGDDTHQLTRGIRILQRSTTGAEWNKME